MTGATWFEPPQQSICSEAANNFVYPINASHEKFGYFMADNTRPTGSPALLPLNDLFFSSEHPGGAHFAFADGSAHFLRDSTDLTILQDMATIAGQEINQWKP